MEREPTDNQAGNREAEDRSAGHAQSDVHPQTTSFASVSSEFGPELQQRLQQAVSRAEQLEQRWPGMQSGLSASIWQAPENIGRFRIVRELGRGGMGVVFLAIDPRLDREIALKIPRPETLLTESLKQRFLNESKVAASLRHPAIVSVYDAGRAGPIVYIASEYCPGPSLTAWLERRDNQVAPKAAASLILKLTRAVAHAHDRGIIHRDLKPGNVLMVPEEGTAGIDLRKQQISDEQFQPMLTDFGLAKALEQSADQTLSNVIVGTPQYMSPEQASGMQQEIGIETDIHAIGVILYELLTGRRPFEGETPLATLQQIRTQPATPLRKLRPGVPRDLELICMKCLAKSPAQRYATAYELGEDLLRFLNGDPVKEIHGVTPRLLLWASRPQRVRDAGVLLLTLSSVFLIWCLIGMVAIVTGQFETASVVGTMLYVGACTVLFYLPMIWIGRRTIEAKSGAVWLGWVHISIVLVILTVLLMGFFDSYLTPLLGDRKSRRIVDLLVYGSWWTVWLAYLLALWSNHQQGRQLS